MPIRHHIFDNSPFSDLARETFPNSPTGPDAFAYALEGYLRTVSELGALDGFKSFYVLEETSTKLRIVGMTYVLPNSLLPLDASFEVVKDDISYRVLLGAEDSKWKGMTESKRWKAVYLYASEGYEPQWNWNPSLEGFLAP